jgi:hypothetical protein
MSKVEIRINSNPYKDLGWCVVNRRPRAYAPDEAIFDSNTGVNTVPFKAWWPNMQRINPEGEMAWWLTWEAEKFNNDQNPEEREFTIYDDVKIRLTGDGGNLKAYYKKTETPTHLQILAYDYLHPEFANNDTLENKPRMVSLCSAIDINGAVRKIAAGLSPRYFQVCRKEVGLWVEKSKVTILEQKPRVWGIPEIMNFRGGI